MFEVHNFSFCVDKIKNIAKFATAVFKDTTLCSKTLVKLKRTRALGILPGVKGSTLTKKKSKSKILGLGY